MPDPALQAEVDAKLAADPEMSNFGCERNTTTATNHHMHAQQRTRSGDSKRDDQILIHLFLPASVWLFRPGFDPAWR